MIYLGAKAVIDCPSFVCPENIAPHLKSVFEGEYDVPVAYHGAEAPTILDLGANFGAFSVWASHRWPGAKIHAYEPNPETAEVAKRNLSLYSNVTLNPWGIGEAGTRILYNGNDNAGECSLHRKGNGTGQHVEIKDPLTLPTADILKMDIEGSELEVLVPLLTDGRSFHAIMFEFHSRALRVELENLLRADYVLTGAHLYHVDLGVLRFVRKGFI